MLAPIFENAFAESRTPYCRNFCAYFPRIDKQKRIELPRKRMLRAVFIDGRRPHREAAAVCRTNLVGHPQLLDGFHPMA